MNDMSSTAAQRSASQKAGKHIALFFIPNIFLPLLIGACLYYLFHPDVTLTQWLNELIHIEIPQELRTAYQGTLWGLILRCYAADFMWAYSVCMAFMWIKEVYHRSLLQMLLICICTSITMEAIQLLPFIRGVFDILDILVQALGNTLAFAVYFLYNAKYAECINKKEDISNEQ